MTAPNPFLLSLSLILFKKISTFFNEWFSHCAVLITFVSLLFLATKVYFGLEVCKGLKFKPEPGPQPRLSDPTWPERHS